MASKEELFVSVTQASYKKDKHNILTSQADLLNVLKRLQNMKVLARRKNDLKIKIRKHLATVEKNIREIQKGIPTSKLPNNFQPKEVIRIEKQVQQEKIQESFSKRAEIEGELMTIQEKLRQLNG